jgi:signal peptidase I
MRRTSCLALLAVSHLAHAQAVELSLDEMRAYSAFRVPSEAMEPAVRSGEIIYVDAGNFQPTVLKVGNVVAFRQKSPSPQLTVKRVVALGGSTVQFHRWKLLVDNKELSEPYVNPDNVMATTSFEWGPVTVDPGCAFVLSDNRDLGNDSRTYGCIRLSDILGIVKFVAPATSPQLARQIQ